MSMTCKCGGECMGCMSCHGDYVIDKAECRYCGHTKRADTISHAGVCPVCTKVIMRKFADIIDGNFDETELAVIGDALDGEWVSDLVERTLGESNESERHAS